MEFLQNEVFLHFLHTYGRNNAQTQSYPAMRLGLNSNPNLAIFLIGILLLN